MHRLSNTLLVIVSVVSCGGGGTTGGRPTPADAVANVDAGGTGDADPSPEEQGSGPSLVRLFPTFAGGPFCLSRGERSTITVRNLVTNMDSVTPYFETTDDHVDVLGGVFNANSCSGPPKATFPLKKGKKYLVVPYIDDRSDEQIAIFSDDAKDDPTALRLRFINLTYGWDAPPSVYIGKLSGVPDQLPAGSRPALEGVAFATPGGTSTLGPVIDGFLFADAEFTNAYVGVYGKSANVPRLYVAGGFGPLAFRRGEKYTILANGKSISGARQPGTFACPDLDDVGTTGEEFHRCIGQVPNKYND